MYERLREVRRPALPPTLYVLIACVVAERVVLKREGGLAQTQLWMVVGVCVGLVACTYLVAWRTGAGGGVYSTVGVFVLAVLLATARAQVCAARIQACSDELGRRAISSLSFVVVGEPSKTDYGYRCEALGQTDNAILGNVWLRGDERLARGTELTCTGSFQKNEDDEWGAQARLQGVSGTVRVGRVLAAREPEGLRGGVSKLREDALAFVEPSASPTRALLAGCVCGWRDDLKDYELDELCSRCGISHLVAVSGSHLAILASMLAGMLVKLRMRPWLRTVVLVLTGGMYVAFCGAPISAIRAWLMCSVAYVGMVCGRRSHGLSGVCLVGTVMALWDPAVTGQIGFLLSVTSVVALGIFGPYATVAMKELFGTPKRLRIIPMRMAKTLSKLLSGIEESLGASLVASIATMPLVAQTFGTLSVVGPLCNAVISLPFSWFVSLGMAAVALRDVPGVGQALLHACDVLGGAILTVADAMGNVPHAEASVASVSSLLGPVIVLGAVLLLVVWPKPTRRRLLLLVGSTAAVVGFWYALGRYAAPSRICVLDVGQGDAILIQDGAQALLVDAGPGDAVVEALARKNVWHLDAALVTHLHADHYEGLLHLEGHCACEQVLVARGVGECVPSELHGAMVDLTGKEPVELAYGDVLRVGRFTLRMVWPTTSVDGDQNAESIELLLEYQDGPRGLVGLLTGDAEKDELAAILKNGDVGNIDFLKVGHHGSEVSLTPDQARTIDPEVSVASAGEGNKYGHPTDACVDALNEAGSTFFCTKDVGDVEILPGEGGPEVRVGL